MKASRETFTICFRASSSISDHGKNVTILSLPAWLGLVDTAIPDWVVADGRNWNRRHHDYSNPILVLTLKPFSLIRTHHITPYLQQLFASCSQGHSKQRQNQNPVKRAP